MAILRSRKKKPRPIFTYDNLGGSPLIILSQEEGANQIVIKGEEIKESIGEHEGSSMAAGAAMAVVGWWSGYKLGGVLSLFSAEYLQEAGYENYWQITFLILSILVVLMNIGLMFINEKDNSESKRFF